jgi:hypothetical protein
LIVNINATFLQPEMNEPLDETLVQGECSYNIVHTESQLPYSNHGKGFKNVYISEFTVVSWLRWAFVNSECSYIIVEAEKQLPHSIYWKGLCKCLHFLKIGISWLL